MMLQQFSALCASSSQHVMHSSSRLQYFSNFQTSATWTDLHVMTGLIRLQLIPYVNQY